MADVEIMGFGRSEPIATHTVRDTLRVAEVFGPAIQGDNLPAITSFGGPPFVQIGAPRTVSATLVFGF